MTRRPRAAVPLLVLLVVLVTALGGCGSRERAGATVRTEDLPSGTTATLISPLGTARVVVGEPVDTVSEDQASDRKQHRAPSGGAFVPVTWQWTFTPGFPFAATGALTHPATISLVSGSTTAHLATIGRTAGTARPVYVAVPSTTGLEVALTYDGVTQTADVATGERQAGPAETLYADAARPRSIGCDGGWRTSIAIRAPVSCDLQVAVVPWAGSWAPKGHEFVIVGADIRPYPFEIGKGADAARYDVRSIADTSKVDGVAARHPLQQDTTVSYAATGTLIFDVPAGAHTLDLSLGYALQRRSGPDTAPLSRTVRFSRSVALP